MWKLFWMDFVIVNPPKECPILVFWFFHDLRGHCAFLRVDMVIVHKKNSLALHDKSHSED